MTKKALVTGASEGIGRALAKQLVADGYQVTGVARSEARLKELQGELGSSAFRFIVADLAAPAGVDKVAADVAQGAYTVLINNAGFGALGEFAEVPIDRQREMIRLNVEALTVLSHAYLARARAGDALINVSSVVGLLPAPGQPVYSATKAFVTFLSECLSQQYGPKGIYVMALCPGATRSQFAERAGGRTGQIPAAFVEPAEDVARRTLEALAARRSTVVVSGRWNELLINASRLLPRRAVRSLMGRARAQRQVDTAPTTH